MATSTVKDLKIVYIPFRPAPNIRLDVLTLGFVICVVMNSAAAISFGQFFLKHERMFCGDFWLIGLVRKI